MHAEQHPVGTFAIAPEDLTKGQLERSVQVLSGVVMCDKLPTYWR